LRREVPASWDPVATASVRARGCADIQWTMRRPLDKRQQCAVLPNSALSLIKTISSALARKAVNNCREVPGSVTVLDELGSIRRCDSETE